jgi:DNA-directed RNA polymerase subunit RPC12/RpoP
MNQYECEKCKNKLNFSVLSHPATTNQAIMCKDCGHMWITEYPSES